jgi:hypothetical protein
MGSKGKYLIFLLLFPLVAAAQEKPDFRKVDSLTYSYYISGDWDNLITVGKNGLASGIDYKFLRQRLGYAYFIKGDYLNAERHFNKALASDSYNQFTLEYLYYSLVNSGKEQYTASIQKRLDPALRAKMKISSFIPVTAIEAEFDYKFSGTTLRSDPRYFRAGISSRLSYRLNLSQSFSDYNTSYSLQQLARNTKVGIRQRGYYASLSINTSPNTVIRGAYHYLYTASGNSRYSGNLFLLSVEPEFNRFSFEGHGSLFTYQNSYVYQAGLIASFVFPVKSELYIKGGASYISRNDGGNFVFNPAAGLRLWKGAWIEAGYAKGNMDRYNDFNGLYVYNTYDPVVSRSGATFTYYLGRHVSFWINYSFETKEYNEDKSYSYNQFSYLGGFKWKI